LLNFTVVFAGAFTVAAFVTVVVAAGFVVEGATGVVAASFVF